MSNKGTMAWLSLWRCLELCDLFDEHGESKLRIAQLLVDVGVGMEWGEQAHMPTLGEWWSALDMDDLVPASEPFRALLVSDIKRSHFEALLGRNVPLPVCFVVSSPRRF